MSRGAVKGACAKVDRCITELYDVCANILASFFDFIHAICFIFISVGDAVYYFGNRIPEKLAYLIESCGRIFNGVVQPGGCLYLLGIAKPRRQSRNVSYMLFVRQILAIFLVAMAFNGKCTSFLNDRRYIHTYIIKYIVK